MSDMTHTRVEHGQKLLSKLLDEYENGDNPDWNLLRNAPGKRPRTNSRMLVGSQAVHPLPTLGLTVCTATAGVRLAPMSWTEACEVIKDGSIEALGKLGRLPLEIRRYRKYRSDHILSDHASVDDFLMAKVFSCPCSPNEGKMMV